MLCVLSYYSAAGLILKICFSCRFIVIFRPILMLRFAFFFFYSLNGEKFTELDDNLH